MNRWDALVCLLVHAGAEVTYGSDGGGTTLAVAHTEPKVIEAYESLAKVLGGRETS